MTDIRIFGSIVKITDIAIDDNVRRNVKIILVFFFFFWANNSDDILTSVKANEETARVEPQEVVSEEWSKRFNFVLSANFQSGGVNFTNFLQTAFIHKDSKSAKNTAK